MKIGIISTYPPIECGIATYSSFLIEELRSLQNRVYIVCHMGGEGLDCYPTFKADDPDLADKAFKKMMALMPDLVHIQHEFGLFGEQRGMNVLPLAYKFKLARVPLVITPHTLNLNFSYEEKIIIKALVEIADASVVHQEYQRKIIKEDFCNKEKVWVIPHGVHEIKPILKAKEKLGYQDKRIILLQGYFRRSKNFELIVRIFPEVAKRVDNALLLIASGARNPVDNLYRDEFLEFVAQSETRDQIKVLSGPFPQETFDLILSASDVAILPYLKGDQSGIMALSLGCGKPVVVSSCIQAMADLVRKSESGLVAGTDTEFIEAIVSILTDKDLAKRFSANAKRYVEEHLLWRIISSKHIEVYNRIRTKPRLRRGSQSRDVARSASDSNPLSPLAK